MVTRWKATSTIHLFLPVLVLCGLITSCAPTLVGPTDPNSSLVVGRIVINNEFPGATFGILPLGTLDEGLEVEVESRDESQFFKVVTEKQGYFFIPNIPPNRYQVRRVRIKGSAGTQSETYSWGLRRFNFTPVPGKIVYIGTLFIELSERKKKKIREVREEEVARAYLREKHGDSTWASREFIEAGARQVVERIGGGEIIGQHYIHERKGYKIALPPEEWYPTTVRVLDVKFQNEGAFIGTGAYTRLRRYFGDVSNWWVEAMSRKFDWTDVKILEERDLTLAGYSAKVVTLEYINRRGKRKIDRTYHILKQGGRYILYRLRMTSVKEKYEEFLPTFERLVKSFSFLRTQATKKIE